jgi:hypothetical protein
MQSTPNHLKEYLPLILFKGARNLIIDKEVELVTKRGIYLHVKEVLERLEKTIVDIALIVLNEGYEFSDYLPCTILPLWLDCVSRL